MTGHRPEDYIRSVIAELLDSYRQYLTILNQFMTAGHSRRSGALDQYLLMEKAAFGRIHSRETVLDRWCRDFPDQAAAADGALKELEILRNSVLSESSRIRTEIRSVMTLTKKELETLRLPRRTKSYGKESAPVLIDIQL